MKKKFLAFVLAATMCLGNGITVFAESDTTPSDSSAASVSSGDLQPTEKVALPIPSNVQWRDNWDMTAYGTDDTTSYTFEVYKDGELYSTESWSGLRNYENDSESYFSAVYYDKMYESGTYKFRVRAIAMYDDPLHTNSEWSEFSPDRVYNRPSTVLGQTAPYWDTTRPGVIYYNEVPGANGYKTRLYVINEDGSSYCTYASWYVGYSVGEAGVVRDEDLSQVINERGAGKYQVTITALSNNVDVVASGEEGARSAVFDTSINAAAVGSSLDDALANSDASAAVDALTANNNIESLQMAMQTDDTVLEKVSELEDKYAEQNNVSVGKSVSSAAAEYVKEDQIQMVGAAFNADEGKKISLDVSVPETKVEVNTNRYLNPVQLSLKLVCDNAEVGTLKMPITITMPIPAGISPAKLNILHYSADGSYEVISPKINADGTITFTVTHFSTFVFAERNDGVKPPVTPDTPAIDPGSSTPSGGSWSADSAIKDKIAAAQDGTTVTIKSDGPITLTRSDLDALAKKNNVSLLLNYVYNNVEYSVLIPAGKVITNDDVYYYGPLYLASLYGSNSGVTGAVGGQYIVKKGDTLGKIAAVNKTTVKKLMALNPQITDANVIRVGQKLKLN